MIRLISVGVKDGSRLYMRATQPPTIAAECDVPVNEIKLSLVPHDQISSPGAAMLVQSPKLEN
jgi:hypothetical protein